MCRELQLRDNLLSRGKSRLWWYRTGLRNCRWDNGHPSVVDLESLVGRLTLELGVSIALRITRPRVETEGRHGAALPGHAFVNVVDLLHCKCNYEQVGKVRTELESIFQWVWAASATPPVPFTDPASVGSRASRFQDEAEAAPLPPISRGIPAAAAPGWAIFRTRSRRSGSAVLPAWRFGT
jgi:hypothetical protein